MLFRSDKDGWQYGSNFSLMRYPPGKGAETRGPLDVVRRRRLVRVRRQVRDQQDPEDASSSDQQPAPVADVSERAMQAAQASTGRQILGQIAPGDLLALPMGWNAPGKQHGEKWLQVRMKHIVCCTGITPVCGRGTSDASAAATGLEAGSSTGQQQILLH